MKIVSRFASFVSIISVVTAAISLAPTTALAAPTTIFSDNFGTGSSVNDIPGWDEAGSDSGSATLAKSAGTGDDSASPDGDRFAKISQDEWICAPVTATGYANLSLSYYWRGDGDAESADHGIAEYKIGGSCSDSSGWSTLQSEDMSVNGSWSTRSAFSLPSGLDNKVFKLRFRASSSASDEFYRVDGVSVGGYAFTVYGMDLVDSDTDTDVPAFTPIPEGATINLDTVAGADHHISIRANTTPTDLDNGSVKFVVTGPTNFNHTENTFPYAIASNGAPTNYLDWTPSIGTYAITATPYSGPNATGVAGNPFTLNVTFTQGEEVPEGSISGTKFDDLNFNGTQDPGEPGLAGWTIELRNGEDTVTTLTNSDGNYSFEAVADGSYTVCEMLQEGWAQTGPLSGAECGESTHGYNVSVSEGGAVTNINFGNTQGVCTQNSMTVVSDTTTGHDGEWSTSVAVTSIPESWTSIPGATWIWSEDPVAGPEEVTRVFTKSFEVTGTPMDSMLEIAADNEYSVSVNGHDINTGDSMTNDMQYNAVDTWTIPAADLVTGTNTIAITVKNVGIEEGENPAGLIYKLTVNSQTCQGPVVDQCPNIEDVQGVIPEGYHIEGENMCVADTENNIPLCTDRLDNDHDGFTDSQDEDCVPSMLIQMAGGLGGGGTVAGTSTEETVPENGGEVAGAEDLHECTLYLDPTKPIKNGKNADPEEVRKLQMFLQTHGYETIVVTGVYGEATRAAVMDFQVAHANEILAPWGFKAPILVGTGNTYTMTTWYINSIMDPDCASPAPDASSLVPFHD